MKNRSLLPTAQNFYHFLIEYILIKYIVIKRSEYAIWYRLDYLTILMCQKYYLAIVNN